MEQQMGRGQACHFNLVFRFEEKLGEKGNRLGLGRKDEQGKGKGKIKGHKESSKGNKEDSARARYKLAGLKMRSRESF